MPNTTPESTEQILSWGIACYSFLAWNKTRITFRELASMVEEYSSHERSKAVAGALNSRPNAVLVRDNIAQNFRQKI